MGLRQLQHWEQHHKRPMGDGTEVRAFTPMTSSHVQKQHSME